jgi:putative ABC transport system permease protein
MINSFLRLYAVEPGIDPSDLLTFQIQFSYGKYVKNTGRRVPSGGTETEITPLLSQTGEVIRQRLAAMPGAESAAVVSSVAPLMGFARRYPFTIDGKPAAAAEQEAQSAEWYPVSTHYFETLKIPVLRGREFGDQDSAAGLPVAVINSTMAKRFWPNEDPMGRIVQFNYYNEPPRQIVGIVGDVRQNLHNDPLPQIYFPMAQLPVVQQMNQSAGLEVLTFVVRSKGNLAELTKAFHSVVDSVDRTQPIFHIQPLEQYVSDQLQLFRQYVLMLGVFGGVAVVLAIVGIYGIMAHSVSQRTNEIGVRMALGAGTGQVLRLILVRGLILIGIGLGVGVGASIGLTRLISSQLWGVQATDPLTFGVVILGLGSIALIACYLPARRALKVDPAVALRIE